MVRFIFACLLGASFISLTGCVSTQTSESAQMVSISSVASKLGMSASRDPSGRMVVLAGARGTVVFNSRLDAILIGDRFCFRGTRVVVEKDSVSIPVGFFAECDKYLKSGSTVTQQPIQVTTRTSSGLVVLDPGHGGNDPGAIAVTGGREKVVNLAVARMVAEKLQAAGIKVILTRDGDELIDLEGRPAIANHAAADAFVAIHSDANGSPATRGFTIFVPHPKYTAAERAALVANQYQIDLKQYNGGRPATPARRQVIVESILVQNAPRSQRLASLINRELGKAAESPGRGIEPGPYRVLKHSVPPAVLIELGFLTNPTEARRLFEADYQNELAGAIARGIGQFLDGK